MILINRYPYFYNDLVFFLTPLTKGGGPEGDGGIRIMVNYFNAAI
jgi:hypothetical protein